MKPKPEPPTLDPIAVARDWLSRYEHCVRQRDYAGAKALFHQRTICFGLDTNLAVDVDAMTKNEWEQVWPNQLRFTFVLSKLSIIPEGNLIAIAGHWTAHSVIAGAKPRHGRATVVLMGFSNKKVLAVHLHMSAAAKVAIV